MNSITAYSDSDQSSQTLMNSLSARPNHDRHRKKLWKAEGAAYLLAVLAHLAFWQVYQTVPQQALEEIKPPVIEVSLMAGQPQPAAPAAAQPPAAPPQPPKPQVQPQPPKPKPVPKVEKPAPPKVEKPKPIPKPKPRPEPETEAAPSPEPVAAPAAPPAPPAPPAPSSSESSHKAATKPAGEAGEDNRFSQGTVGGYGSRPYPAIARERGWVGAVTAKIRVSADGEIEDVSIVSSSGHEVLDEYAIDKIQSASRVQPCHRGEKPVACSFTQTIHFTLNRE